MIAARGCRSHSSVVLGRTDCCEVPVSVSVQTVAEERERALPVVHLSNKRRKEHPSKVAVRERLGTVEKLIRHALAPQPAKHAVKKRVAV